MRLQGAPTIGLLLAIALSGCFADPTICIWKTEPTIVPGSFQALAAHGLQFSPTECPDSLCNVSYRSDQEIAKSIDLWASPSIEVAAVYSTATPASVVRNELNSFMAIGGFRDRLGNLSRTEVSNGVLWRAPISVPSLLTFFEAASEDVPETIIYDLVGSKASRASDWTFTFSFPERRVEIGADTDHFVTFQVDARDMMTVKTGNLGAGTFSKAAAAQMAREALDVHGVDSDWLGSTQMAPAPQLLGQPWCTAE